MKLRSATLAAVCVKFVAITMLACAGAAFAVLDQPPANPSPHPADQPAGPRGQRPEREGRQPPEQGGFGDGTMLKERLQRRLDESGRVHTALLDALARLDKGDSPKEVLEDLAPFSRMFLRGNNQEGGGGGGGVGGLNNSARPDDNMPGVDNFQRPPADGGGRNMNPPTPEERERMMNALREHAPQLARKFDAMLTNEPAAAPRLIGRIFPRLREALSLRERDVEMFKLRIAEIENSVSLMEAMREYRMAHNAPAGSPRLDDVEKSLRALIAQQFDLRNQVQAREIEDLTRRLNSMRANLELKQADRDKTINEIMRKILEGKEPRELAPPGPNGPRNPAAHPPR